jgi:hypothetical protein
MATKTLTADRSSILAWTGSAGLGGGQDAHLAMVASASGYDLRGLINWTIPAGWWSDVKKLTKAEVLLTGTSGAGTHVGKGASPKALVRRIINAWTPNSAGESWTTSPAVYPGPSVTTSGGVTAALPTGATQVAIDITAIAMAWAPASVIGPSGAAGAGAAFYGLALHETGGAADAAEIYSAEHGTASQRPIIRLTYETNSPPYAPTLIKPLGPDQAAADFEFQTADPEGDAITAYDLQVSTDSTFSTVTHWSLANQTSGLTAGHVLRNYGGTALVNGTRYYWRARMRDAGGFSAWSAVGTFVKAAGGGPAADVWDYWMSAILVDMAEGRTAIRVGTLRPVGEQVAALICAEFGDLFRVAWDETSPPVDEPVYLLGERVSVSPEGWAVDAVVELRREVG